MAHFLGFWFNILSIHAGEAKTFNGFHCRNIPTDVKDRRSELFRQRIADGYFLFIYLELCQQLGIPDYQVYTGCLGKPVSYNLKSLFANSLLVQPVYQEFFKNRNTFIELFRCYVLSYQLLCIKS